MIQQHHLTSKKWSIYLALTTQSQPLVKERLYLDTTLYSKLVQYQLPPLTHIIQQYHLSSKKLTENVNQGKLVSKTQFMSYKDRRAKIEVGVTSALFELTLLGSTLAQKRASSIIPSHFHFSTCRYFGTLENGRRTCYNCDEDGCAAFHCTSTKRN